MSDHDVEAALDAMERLLQSDDLDAASFLAWQQRFDESLATAERGPGWPDLVGRAHALSQRLDAAIHQLSLQKVELGKQLNLNARGSRALKGYKPV